MVYATKRSYQRAGRRPALGTHPYRERNENAMFAPLVLLLTASIGAPLPLLAISVGAPLPLLAISVGAPLPLFGDRQRRHA